MATLAEFGIALCTGTVKVRGKDVPATAISADLASRIYRAMPDPRVPYAKDPGKGSAADLVPDRQDPTYKAARSEWSSKVAAVQVALALGLTVDGLVAPDDAAAFTTWCGKAATELRRVMSDEEITAVLEQVDKLGNPTKLRDEAKKN